MRCITLKNGGAIPLKEIPELSFAEFHETLKTALTEENCRVSAYFRLPGENECVCMILLDPDSHCLRVMTTRTGGSYPSFTPEFPALHWFERELRETDGIIPEGHPWLKPLRFSHPGQEPAVTDYFTMTGDAAHEVAVGPVHAGVIEPGHFRFQCVGENVSHLEISLGYQHRGLEAMLTGALSPRTLPLLECAAGDTSAGAAINACRILETLGGIEVSPRSMALRRLALELERIANHTGDLGALAGDVAFLPTASFCGRIRGDFLNMTASLCGNRFGRGLVVPGGVRHDLASADAEELLRRVTTGEKELFHALDLMFDEPSVLDRLENTGTVSSALARKIGLVGVAARASGVPINVRHDLPESDDAPLLPIALGKAGDVFSRALVRKQELENSIAMVKKLLSEPLPEGENHPAALKPLAPGMLAVSITEAWRGELVHLLVTNDRGEIARAKIVDPSFHNWFGLAMALRDQQISDFPICNKSFNLSYCGHDL